MPERNVYIRQKRGEYKGFVFCGKWECMSSLKIDPPEGTSAKIAREQTNPICFPSISKRKANGPRPKHNGVPTLGPCI